MSINPKRPYVSVIKINGKPILPPLITSELRKELAWYKKQAIKLEKRLSKCRELKRNLDDLLEAQNNNTRPISQLTFGDNSHIEALDISDKPEFPRKLSTLHLSQDLVEVTQYNPHGLETFCSNLMIDDSRNSICDNTELSKIVDQNGSFVIENGDYKNVSGPAKDVNGSIQNETPPKPRLIRSNSYTLETPSPILLEHLKKTSFRNDRDNSSLASQDNNHTSSDFSSLNTVFHKEFNDKRDTAASPDKSSFKEVDKRKSPTIEVYQTDISVQQITVNTNGVGPNGCSKKDKQDAFFVKNPFGALEPDSELMDVLKDIPETYANQIIDLLMKQHLEQKERLERYDNLNGGSEKVCLNSEEYRTHDSGILSQSTPYSATEKSYSQWESKPPNDDNLIDLSSLTELDLAKPASANQSRPNTSESCTNSGRHSSGRLKRSSTFSMSPSQSLHYSVTSDSDTINERLASSVLELDDRKEESGNVEVGVLREKNGYWEGVLVHESEDRNFRCSRELFPVIDPVTMNAMKQEWAASVIGAYVRGYLTRRLIKTEKVQNLIATVKDVLMCALELHHSDNIDEKDVELHRRLINQLSAALYSFHEIFFDLTTYQQMALIAADRQRKIEKLKRPHSARNSLRSSRSATSSRSSRSLNTSRSSSKHKLINESPTMTKV